MLKDPLIIRNTLSTLLGGHWEGSSSGAGGYPISKVYYTVRRSELRTDENTWSITEDRKMDIRYSGWSMLATSLSEDRLTAIRLTLGIESDGSYTDISSRESVLSTVSIHL